MNEELRRHFPNAIGIGEGIALSESPFVGVCETEYYDGPIAGFAFFKEAGTVAIFKKIWWDEGQNNRLFELQLAESKRLGEVSDLLSDLITRAKRERWVSLPAAERGLASQLFDAVGRLSDAHLLVLARDITGPLFILPFVSDD